MNPLTRWPLQAWGPIAGFNRRGTAAATENWWTWLDETYTVVGAYDFRSSTSLADATKIGDTPTVVTEPGGGIVLGASGLVCDGDTALDTGIVVTNTDNYSMYAIFSNATTSGQLAIIAGASTGDERFSIGPHWSLSGMFAGVGAGVGAGNYAINSPTMAEGGYGVSDETPYRNGSTDGSKITGTSTSLSPYSIFIGARNFEGDQTASFNGNIAAFVITSDTISESDMESLHTAMV
jgi:hypothetical protein